MKKNYYYAIVGVAACIIIVLLVLFFFRSSLPQMAGSNGEKAASLDVDEWAMSPEAASDDAVSLGRVSAPSEPGTAEQNTGDQKSGDRLIIKTGSLSLVVKDVTEALKAISAFATKNNGFVVHSEINEYNFAPLGTITIRIPSEIFDKGISEVKQLGEVKNESVNGQDVTEEFVDLDSRLKNLRAAESQFLEIMKKAVKIEDVLAVQRELTNVRAQIEQIEGRMKYLKESARLSTLTISVSTDPSQLPVVDTDDKWHPIATLKDAARSLIDALKDLGDLVIWFVVYIPVVLVWMLGLWIVYRIGKYIHKRISRHLT